MFTQIFENPWWLAVGTVAFFTLKGCLWLVIPGYMVSRRMRRRANVLKS